MFRFAANEHGWPMRMVEHRPVACVPSGDVLRCLPISPESFRGWAHRLEVLEVYVPLTRAYRRKHPIFIPASKITPMCWENLNMTEKNKKIAGNATRIRRFRLFSVYGVGAAFASFLPPFPAFTSTSVADIV